MIIRLDAVSMDVVESSENLVSNKAETILERNAGDSTPTMAGQKLSKGGLVLQRFP